LTINLLLGQFTLVLGVFCFACQRTTQAYGLA